MTTAIESADSETMGDLLKRLGDISPDRVRMRPAPGTATVADVLAIESKENRLFELLDGVLVEKCMGYRESLLAARILIALGIWVQPRKLGELSGADGMMSLFPGLVLLQPIDDVQIRVEVPYPAFRTHVEDRTFRRAVAGSAAIAMSVV